jgi:hypothetical protein
VASLILSDCTPFITNDTVVRDTPARAATSLLVTR